DRYVVLAPGSAVDCCGDDILVAAEDTIDLQAFPAVKALFDHPDKDDHVLQISICYRECPTEDIPVLYDDCGCDDSQCAPNRILESYVIDVPADPVTPPAPVTPACGAPLRQVRPCPDCGTADCVVLATIRGYQPGRRLLDPADPPTDPGDDAKNGIARIDNLD